MHLGMWRCSARFGHYRCHQCRHVAILLTAGFNCQQCMTDCSQRFELTEPFFSSLMDLYSSLSLPRFIDHSQGNKIYLKWMAVCYLSRCAAQWSVCGSGHTECI
ncbi:uncharacterized protein BT62DRAFT_303446 [Guyanagaster necrorhizus]|uniref:Uncharacterized protein n=1 Tax=Guyanagaster necrorhizus TaxID=856835 RepID=A0A9P7VP29_9AGAR|nr:uncharacterized protein BT62DRAFT_303446 [Guyanagaster necrorhizus MCA 3950]KAG7443880.1 hypothetical protein BT62DRAFT_303446 [Guyanagaster necrorhizus MCA 3950]